MKTTHYADDRSYTDTIHDSIIVPKIYPQLGWTPYALDKELAQLQDSDYAIDYHATNTNGELIAIQERFRRGRAAKMYNDFTLRYERENNEEEIEQKSEWFKMKGKIKRFKKPYYMLYGVVNDTFDDLYKYAVIDLRVFFDAFRQGKICIDTEINNTIRSKVKDGILYAGCGKNKDDSSSFVTFDIIQLHQVLPEAVIAQQGYFGTATRKAEVVERKEETTVDGRTCNATPKQIQYLERLASDNNFRIVNRSVLTRSEASHLINYFTDGKNKEEIKVVNRILQSGMLNSISTFLSVS